jgi:hypothetical protein
MLWSIRAGSEVPGPPSFPDLLPGIAGVDWHQTAPPNRPAKPALRSKPRMSKPGQGGLNGKSIYEDATTTRLVGKKEIASL